MVHFLVTHMSCVNTLWLAGLCFCSFAPLQEMYTLHRVEVSGEVLSENNVSGLPLSDWGPLASSSHHLYRH